MPTHEFGGAERRGTNRLLGRHAYFGESDKLVGVFALAGRRSCVETRCDLHAQFAGEFNDLLDSLFECLIR